MDPAFGVRLGADLPILGGDAQAAYLWNSRTFVSYESPEAIRLKCRFVKERKLGGLMYREHGHDNTRQLLGIIREELSGQ